MKSKNNLNKRSQKRKKKKLKKIGIMFIIIILSAIGFASWYYSQLIGAMNNQQIELSTTNSEQFTLQEKTNVLVLGIDSAIDEKTAWRTTELTDAIMIININPTSKKIQTVSIPRDTGIKSSCNKSTKPGENLKINSVTTFVSPSIDENKQEHIKNGLDCMVEELNNNFGIKISQVVRVNMQNIMDFVEEIDGLEFAPNAKNFGPQVNGQLQGMNQYGEKNADLLFTAGQKRTFNGTQALAYSRVRYDSDFYRGLRQQEIMAQIVAKLKSNPILALKIPTIINKMNNNGFVSTFKGKEITNLPSILKDIQGYELTSFGQLEMIKTNDALGNYKISEKSLNELIQKFQI